MLATLVYFEQHEMAFVFEVLSDHINKAKHDRIFKNATRI